MVGDIMGISRLRMGTDGEGITALVVFYGCPLKCKYCINDFCHKAPNSYFDQNVPRATYIAEELVQILTQDEIYFLMTHGGVTFGGGEPLMQAEFIKEVCTIANTKWNMRIETSLYVPWEKVLLLVEFIDEWIVDIKETNDEIYQKYTGKGNNLVISNLKKLLAVVSNNRIRVRVP